MLGVAATGAALLLPQVRFAAIGSIDGFRGDAWPVLLPLAPAVLAAILGRRSLPVHPAAGLAVVACGCLAFLFAVAKLLDAGRAVADAGGSVGAGAWVVPAAVLVVVGGGLVGMVRR
jgi:hypothetical protein